MEVLVAEVEAEKEVVEEAQSPAHRPPGMMIAARKATSKCRGERSRRGGNGDNMGVNVGQDGVRVEWG